MEFSTHRGSVTPVSGAEFLATPIEDFFPMTSIVIPDGANSGVIEIPITDDDIPEVDETFRVTLDAVHLFGDSPFKPRLSECDKLQWMMLNDF